jgi:amino acid transporter
VITITLSAADATAHIVENPLARAWSPHRVAVTFVLVAALGAVFVRGIREAVWVALLIVAVYLILNAAVVGRGLWHISTHPETLTFWRNGLFTQEPSYFWIIVAAVLAFPRLALGLSGFETGVAVMPLVKGDGETEEERLASRIRNTKSCS